MFEIRFHGRGGQGAVMAAQTLAEAAVIEGWHANAFPYFGAERRGAPVMAFARIDDRKISIKSQVYEPDLLVILDETLLDIEPVARGLKADGKAVVNTGKAPQEIDLGLEVDCVTVDATNIAMEFLKAPIVNTAILGGVAKVCDLVSIDSMREAIGNRFGDKFGETAARANVGAAVNAYEQAIVGRCQGLRPLVARSEWLPEWRDIPLGTTLAAGSEKGVAIGPGGAIQNLTGSWRTRTPHYDRDKCVRCLRCWFSCPDACIKREEDDHVSWELDYCKGCGICAQVCPAKAIDMVKGATR
ncbi:MAG: 2-oxoacid:acceptor oxidoreductase family protein [Methanomassiliicoccales archaeon]|nr:2-oxoacid:acceptor oxidoreductase family protein [Methanomassiliicoccales archaeon]